MLTAFRFSNYVENHTQQINPGTAPTPFGVIQITELSKG